MKNKDFFYLQYNKVDWKNQEKTKINQYINNHIIQKYILKSEGNEVSIFDIGFGIGFFIEMLARSWKKQSRLFIAGCEPSKVNYSYFSTHGMKRLTGKFDLSVTKNTFQDVEIQRTFDFVTAIYVFPHFLSDDLNDIAVKIKTTLKKDGQFILVVANEEYLKNKLRIEKDLFIETKDIQYHGKQYREVLHYSDIPEIGKIIDYNRETAYYIDLFRNNGFLLNTMEDIDDNGFICTLLHFKKT